jgi:tetratricopeptide (TPR) repeat protein
MQNYDFNSLDDEFDDSYPDFFLEWDGAVSSGEKPGFYDPEELTEIVEIYISENKIKRAKQAINYALRIYSDDEDILYEILLILNDYELWNDLFSICEQYKERNDVWVDGHKLTALLHLGMEEDAFLLFWKLKTQYSGNKEDLSVIYQAMGEALCEMNLFDSSIDVIQEAINTLDEDINFYWLQLQCYVSLNLKEEVSELTQIIQKLNPLDATTWQRLGDSFLEINDLEKAIDAFEYAQSLGYDSKAILMNLIYAYERNKNLGKALEKAKEYLNLYPDSCSINILAAQLNSQMENWEGALKHVNEAIELVPSLESLYLYKSNFFLHLEEYKKAKLALMEGILNTKDTDGDLIKELSRLNEQYPDY